MEYPGLYIHVPFCVKKCAYCDFYSVTSLSLVSAWLDAVEKEAAAYTGMFARFDSIYLGGGTPSLLDDEQLAKLVNCLYRHFDFLQDTEFTIEANPDDLNPDKLDFFRKVGINRISIGVQSLNEDELRFLGRRHTAGQTMRALEWVRAAGFDNVGLDLIYGFRSPRGGSFRENWAKTLESAVAFGPEHLSCYQMTIEKSTPLGRMQSEGKIKPLSEKQETELFLHTSRFLEDHGYIHYEVSNFARDPARTSRHNQKYWRHVPYLGLGPSAHSFRDGMRWWNAKSVRDYCRSLSGGALPVEGREVLEPEQLRLEALFLGSRTKDGFSVESIRDLPGAQGILRDLEKSHVVEVNDGRVIPTRKGFLVADSLPLLFAD